MRWTAGLKAVAAEKAAQPKPPKPRKPLKREPPSMVITQVRRPSGNDPGEVATVYYTVDGDRLTLTDEMGRALDKRGTDHILSEGDNPRAVAAALARNKLSEEGQFGRRLEYEGRYV